MIEGGFFVSKGESRDGLQALWVSARDHHVEAIDADAAEPVTRIAQSEHTVAKLRSRCPRRPRLAHDTV